MVRGAKASLQTLDWETLAKTCKILAQQVETVFTPDLVVGIETGGAVVGELIRDCLSADPAFVAVRLQRQSTKVKNRLGAHRILRPLPKRLKDILRLTEV